MNTRQHRERLGIINAEGGPLLLADFRLAQLWRGIDDDSTDYQRACDAFDSLPRPEGAEITIANGRGFLWDMGGPGTADVFNLNDGGILIVRTWPHDPQDDSTAAKLGAVAAKELLDIGHLTVSSGAIAILWATEDGRCLHSSDIVARRPSGETSVGNSALIVQARQNSFRCQHDEVEADCGIARRLQLLTS